MTNKAADTIRIATFNLKHGAKVDGYRGRPRLVTESCKSLETDILALQEVDRGVTRSRWSDLATVAASGAGMNKAFAKTMDFRIGEYGNALLVKGEIEDYEELPLDGAPRFKLRLGNRRLPPFGYEPRNAILATAVIGERRLSVATTHLSTDQRLGRRQLASVMAALACRPEPRVLLGDLNMPREKVKAVLPADDWQLAESAPTFPADNPRKQIDHIAVNGLAIQVAEARRMPISDHLALITEVE